MCRAILNPTSYLPYHWHRLCWRLGTERISDTSTIDQFEPSNLGVGLSMVIRIATARAPFQVRKFVRTLHDLAH